MAAVDVFSVATCKVKDAGLSVKGWIVLYTPCDHSKASLLAEECISDHGKALCSEIGGECVTERDGYYTATGLCVTFGVLFLVFYTIPTARRLQGKKAHVHPSDANSLLSPPKIKMDGAARLILSLEYKYNY
jgi:PAT family acetyl-CoA transporter-like MFS transporter 1